MYLCHLALQAKPRLTVVVRTMNRASDDTAFAVEITEVPSEQTCWWLRDV